jgi:short-subunit dehydrogenase
MKALITGASYGLGADFARELAARGWDLILVSRRKEKLIEVKKSLGTNVRVIAMDLSVPENVIKLHKMTRKENIDLLINNAGYGIFGAFTETDLDLELNIIDLNIKAYHILMKLVLKDMVKRNSGRILNVASSASFGPGPMLSTYYATKAYLLSITCAIYEELRSRKSAVKISVLCPGPTATEFTRRAGGSFNFNEYKSEDVVRYGLKKMFRDKLIIVPGMSMKLLVLSARVLSRKMQAKITLRIQGKQGH